MALTVNRTDWEDLANNAGIDEVRTNYSGRGMYGRECVGIVVDGIGDLVEFVLYVQREAEQYNDDYETDLHVLVDALVGVESDGMGRGTIFYWPRIQAED